MAEIGGTVATLTDHVKRMDPDGSISVIVEILNQVNEILPDILYMEGNLPTGHRVSIRTGLPEVFWRLANKGVPTSKSNTAQVDEMTAHLEAWSEVDPLVANLNANMAAFRLSEARAFIESMGIEKTETLFFGNAGTSPEEFTGFATRYSDLSAVNAQNILDAGGVGSDNSSIWLIVWGENTVFGLYPKGTQVGLVHKDLGEETAETTSGLGGERLRVLRDMFTWDCGLAVKDWRYVVRIANIDISALVAEVSAADLTKFMIKAIHRIPNLNAGKAVFYMNRTLFQMLDIQRREDVKSGGQLSYEVVDGKMVAMFRTIPVRKVDALPETEARVT